MKRLLYSALIGSLALAVSAQAADPKQPKKPAKGHGAPHAQKAPVRTAGPAHTNMHASSKPMHVQRKSVNNPAVVHQNKIHGNGNVAMHHGNVNKTAVSANVARNRNVNVARAHNASINQQRSVTVNQQKNLNVNRHHNVAIVNRWNGSAYHAPQYSAFRNYRRSYHDRSYYVNRYPRIVIFGGGNYYWDNGYWYPAWGYNSGYNYGYDGPIYGYNNLPPDQVVTNVQAALQQQGYYDSRVDGSLGPITRRAIAAFQADNGLAVTSAIDQPTLATLGLS